MRRAHQRVFLLPMDQQIPLIIQAARLRKRLYAWRRKLLRDGKEQEAAALTTKYKLDPLPERKAA